MIIARWHLTARFGKRDATVALLKKWEQDVGQRIGWRTTRLLTGLLGEADSSVELEVRVDNLSDLEAAWADMSKVPYHAEYARALEPLIEGGGSRWTVLREASPEAEAS